MQKTITLRLSEGELNVLRKTAAAQRLSLNALIMRTLDQGIAGLQSQHVHDATTKNQPTSAALEGLDFDEE